jgi:hypothetical protein
VPADWPALPPPTTTTTTTTMTTTTTTTTMMTTTTTTTTTTASVLKSDEGTGHRRHKSDIIDDRWTASDNKEGSRQ